MHLNGGLILILGVAEVWGVSSGPLLCRACARADAAPPALFAPSVPQPVEVVGFVLKPWGFHK